MAQKLWVYFPFLGKMEYIHQPTKFKQSKKKWIKECSDFEWHVAYLRESRIELSPKEYIEKLIKNEVLKEVPQGGV
jgi:hypothetical protein